MFDVLGRIKELREEKGWTVYRVAKEAGIPQSSMITWKSKNANPPLEAIDKICKAFEISLSEFFEENQDKVETNLARLRKQKGLTQQELASISGIPAEIISSFEQREFDIRKASYASVESLAKALGCKMEDIAVEENVKK